MGFQQTGPSLPGARLESICQPLRRMAQEDASARRFGADAESR